jgi:N-acetylglucosaminyldiphosphoundecaprenol N-acetyl-beta-D-mannosaminyltransferase
VTDNDEKRTNSPRCAQGDLETVDLFNMTINNLTLDETLEAMGNHIESGEQGYVVTPNVDHVVEFSENELFRQAYQEASFVLADGVPILWAGKLFRKPIKEKISGSDLLYWLSDYSAQKGYSLFLLGAAEGVGQEAGRILEEKYPGLKIAGTYSPPLGFEKDPEENKKAIDLIRESGADICYTALGAPKQDLWNWQYHKETGTKLCLGIGASLDFVAGRVKRAPVWMQRVGLEWTWRIMQEPVRMGKRYLIRDAYFFVLLCREWRGKS